MKKEYYSESLDEILRKHINISNYGQSAALLRDIFQRRAYEFGFSDKHMESEIKNFKRNCRSINFLSSESFKSKSVGGSYSHGIKSIKINLESTFFEKSPNIGEEVYETLTHEVYHAISARKDRTTGLTYKDEYGYEQGTALNEIFTEVAANRTSRNITPENETKTSGYGDLTPALQMLSLSLGIPQKELLRAGIQNREELMKCISNKFQTHEQLKNAEDMLKAIELNLNGIYNFRYNKDIPQTDMRRQVYNANCYSLSDNFKKLAEYQMNNDPTITPEEKSYRLERMDEIQKEMDYTLLGVLELSVSKIDDETRREKFEQEHDGGKEWDNEKITNLSNKIFSFNKKFNPEIIFKKIINKVKAQKNKFLGPGKEETKENEESVHHGYRETEFDRKYRVRPEDFKENEESVHHGYRETEFDRKYRVRPEDLRPMEEVRAETARKMELKRQRESQMQESESERQLGSQFNDNFNMSR